MKREIFKRVINSEILARFSFIIMNDWLYNLLNFKKGLELKVCHFIFGSVFKNPTFGRSTVNEFPKTLNFRKSPICNKI